MNPSLIHLQHATAYQAERIARRRPGKPRR